MLAVLRSLGAQHTSEVEWEELLESNSYNIGRTAFPRKKVRYLEGWREPVYKILR